MGILFNPIPTRAPQSVYDQYRTTVYYNMLTDDDEIFSKVPKHGAHGPFGEIPQSKLKFSFKKGEKKKKHGLKKR